MTECREISLETYEDMKHDSISIDVDDHALESYLLKDPKLGRNSKISLYQGYRKLRAEITTPYSNR